MIRGIGVDIVETGRFQRFLDDGNRSILERIFTPEERAICGRRRDAASCLAARFAAKEAFLKALGTGLREGLSWHDMEVVTDDLGKPELLLTGKAHELFQSRKLHTTLLSLSHDGGHAVAMVVLEAS